MNSPLSSGAAVAVLATATSTVVRADEQKPAYVDEVANYTSLQEGELRETLRDALARADYRAEFANPKRPPCAEEDRACVAKRAETRGAAIGLRATWVELAGEISVVLDTVAPRGGAARHVVSGVGKTPSRDLATVIASIEIESDEGMSGRRVAAWSLGGASLAFAAGGAAASLRAWQKRRTFFDEHVDDRGNVVGISPSRAKAAEDRARAWAVAGTILLAGAAVSGVTAGVLFVEGGSEGDSTGVIVGGRF